MRKACTLWFPNVFMAHLVSNFIGDLIFAALFFRWCRECWRNTSAVSHIVQSSNIGEMWLGQKTGWETPLWEYRGDMKGGRGSWDSSALRGVGSGAQTELEEILLKWEVFLLWAAKTLETSCPQKLHLWRYSWRWSWGLLSSLVWAVDLNWSLWRSMILGSTVISLNLTCGLSSQMLLDQGRYLG